MIVHFIEATNGFNWGKFMLQVPDTEWSVESQIDGSQLLRGRGWGNEHILVFDMETGEGAIFKHGGMAAADLTKHKVWVCPMFEPFLEWLYAQDITDITKLPRLVNLNPVATAKHTAMWGYRRPGE